MEAEVCEHSYCLEDHESTKTRDNNGSGLTKVLTMPVYSHPSLLFPTAHCLPPKIKSPWMVGIRGLLCLISRTKRCNASRRKNSPRSKDANRRSFSGRCRQACARITFKRKVEKYGPPRAISRKKPCKRPAWHMSEVSSDQVERGKLVCCLETYSVDKHSYAGELAMPNTLPGD